MPDNKSLAIREALLKAEAILIFLVESKAANDDNAEVVVESLAESARTKIADALEILPE